MGFEEDSNNFNNCMQVGLFLNHLTFKFSFSFICFSVY